LATATCSFTYCQLHNIVNAFALSLSKTIWVIQKVLNETSPRWNSGG
jgi:hypothetical protein